MRKASMILGIIGGVIAILVSLFAILGGMAVRTVMPEMMEQMPEIMEELETQDGYTVDMSDMPNSEEFETASNFAGGIFTGLGVVILIVGILGIVGGAIVKKNNVVAGVLMLIACVISIFTVWGLFAFLPLLLGGIFALVKDNSTAQPQVQY